MMLRCCLMISAIALAGCGDLVSPPAKTNAAAPAPAATTAAAPAPAAEAPAPKPEEPKPAEKPAEPKEQQFCQNGRFEDWEGDVPAGWVAEADQIAKSSDVTSGKNSVELKEIGEYVVLEQPITNLPKGTKFRVSAKIKADSSNDAVLKAVYMMSDEWMSQSAIYEGDDIWKVVAFEMTIPAEASANTFRVQILRRPEAKGAIVVDDVSVAIRN